MKLDMTKVAAGDRITLRCGGVVTVRSVKTVDGKYDDYRTQIQIESYHAGDHHWSFNDIGENGGGTGPDEELCPLDVMLVDRDASTMKAEQ